MNKRAITILFGTFMVFFFSWFFISKTGVNQLQIQSEDTVPALFVPLAIINDQTLYLDNYQDMMREKYPNPDERKPVILLTPFYLSIVPDHVLSAFPIITPIIAIPVFLIAKIFGVVFDWNSLALLAHISGSIICALSAMFFYLLIRELKASEKTALLLTILYAFGTINFSLVSQGLWQHGTVQLFTIIALINLVKFIAGPNYKYIAYFSFFMCVAVLSRPTAALVLVIFSIYLAFRYDFLKVGWYLFLGFIAPVVFFAWYNSKYYQGIQNQGYTNQLFKNWLGGFPMSFLGVWLSPSKGILVYSPVFIYSFIGLYKAIKTKVQNLDLYLLCGIVVLLHTLIISFWKHWFGGWSFGYRMSSDVIPFLVILILPFLENTKTKLFMWVLSFSILVQVFGLVFFDGIWHAAYDKGYKNTAWLWSIKDSEFAFNIRRILVKFGYLTKACDICLER